MNCAGLARRLPAAVGVARSVPTAMGYFPTRRLKIHRDLPLVSFRSWEIISQPWPPKWLSTRNRWTVSAVNSSAPASVRLRGRYLQLLGHLLHPKIRTNPSPLTQSTADKFVLFGPVPPRIRASDGTAPRTPTGLAEVCPGRLRVMRPQPGQEGTRRLRSDETWAFDTSREAATPN